MEETRLRENTLNDWLATVSPQPVTAVIPLAGDASFRRYSRVHTTAGSYIAMDAPPQRESCHAFVAIARAFHQLGIRTPTIFAENTDKGFLLLSDFGDQLLLDTLSNDTADKLYHQAFDDLLILQSCQAVAGYDLPQFNNSLYGYYEEMSWFITWYLQQYRHQQLTATALAALERELHLIAKTLLTQPTVCVHRDFHSRNIMITDNGLGVLDFQDAVWGPITYDLMSLLRDCYIDWPEDQVDTWALAYHQRLLDDKRIALRDQALFLRWFDWASLQRHLKCIGLFVRLHLRDGKSGYLQYIPRMVTYIQRECQRYPELPMLQTLMHKE